MRIVTRFAAALSFIALGACASPGSPPGGPVDTEAPQILGLAPDSGRTGVTPRNVVFRFDEVVSERPSGAASLNALFLISPRDGEPRVDWNRDEIAIRPRRGWKANTAYTITLLPGLSDLRGNVRNTGAVTVFSTGRTIPSGRISGTVFDWVERRVLARALVEARPVTDTTIVYVTTTDSTGTFTIGNLSAGQYAVRGIADANNNRALDPREAWDSTRITLADSASTELLTFVRDSLGSRLMTVTLRDSVTLELSFENPLSLSAPLTAANVRIAAADSVQVPIVSIGPPPPDTTIAAGRVPSRPSPTRTMILKLGRRLAPRTEYRVKVTDAVNLSGVRRSSDRTVLVPEQAAATPPPTATPPAAPPSAPAPPRRLE